MKKASTLLLILLLGMTACKKETTQVTKVEQVNQAFSIKSTIPPDAWSTSDDGYDYNATIDVPELGDNNAAIFDHGAVLVYLEIDEGIYEALPEVFGGIAYGAIHNTGKITIDISDAVGEVKVTPPDYDINIKIILIDAQLLELHPDVNLHDYHSVQQAFKVK